MRAVARRSLRFRNLGVSRSPETRAWSYGVDYTVTSSTLVDFRFGWFQYKVDVLPNVYGANPATEAGIPDLNIRRSVNSGLPYFGLRGTSPRWTAAGSLNDNAGRCNCPLAENEKQWQAVGNITKCCGNHTFKFGLDVRRAYNLRVPSDSHRSGQLQFQNERTSSPTLGGGLGLATFMLGDVTTFSRYVSTSTNARERQWRHFYYGQDTWRFNPRLTFNYGLRLDVINPQTVNEAGNGAWVDLLDGPRSSWAASATLTYRATQNRLNWAPRLGATYQLTDKTVSGAGFGRSYDLGVFGSLFGHTVTQNLPVLAGQNINRANQFASVFNLAQGPRAPDAGGGRHRWTFAWPKDVNPRVTPRNSGHPEVDAWNVTVQRQLTSTISVELGYVANHGGHVFAENNPDDPGNQAAIDGFTEGIPTNLRRPFFAGGVRPNVLGIGGPTGGLRTCCCISTRRRTGTSRCRPDFTKRFSDGWSAQLNYTLQKAENQDNDYWIYDPNLNKGPTDFDRTHNFTASVVYELPIGNGKKVGTDWDGRNPGSAGRLAAEHECLRPERLPLQRDLPKRQSRPGHRPEPARSDWRPGDG